MLQCLFMTCSIIIATLREIQFSHTGSNNLTSQKTFCLFLNWLSNTLSIEFSICWHTLNFTNLDTSVSFVSWCFGTGDLSFPVLDQYCLPDLPSILVIVLMIYFPFFSWQVLVLATQVLCLGKQQILEALSLGRQVFIACAEIRDCYVQWICLGCSTSFQQQRWNLMWSVKVVPGSAEGIC